jgi:thiol:disulfide interchange protein DsbD
LDHQSRHGTKGVPTIVFFDSTGVERRDLRLVDYLPPEQFLSRMRTLSKNGG